MLCTVLLFLRRLTPSRCLDALGKTAIYYGSEEYFDDQKGHTLLQNQPLAVGAPITLFLGPHGFMRGVDVVRIFN
jgi:hypothetical protein